MNGYFIDANGYIKVIKPKGHPTKGRYIFLHRLVMEKKIGRYLTPIERVHHIDNNRQNNAPENLQLFANQSEHAKQGCVDGRIYKKIWDREWLVKEYTENGRAYDDIAEEIGCCGGTVRNVLKRLEVPMRKYTMSEKALASRHKGAIALKPREFDATVWRLRPKLDDTQWLKDKHRGERQKRVPLIYDKEWIEDKYLKQNMTIDEIAKEAGCSRRSVDVAMLKCGIAKRRYTKTDRVMKNTLKGADLGGRKPYVSFESCDPEWIKREYVDNKRSFRDIGGELGWHKNKVKRYLEKLGVALRGHQEQTSMWMKNFNNLKIKK